MKRLRYITVIFFAISMVGYLTLKYNEKGINLPKNQVKQASHPELSMHNANLSLITFPTTDELPCRNIEQMITEYRKNQLKTSLGQKALKKLFIEVLKKVFGKIAGAIVGILEPTEANPPIHKVYIKAMHLLKAEFEKENPEPEKITQTLESIRISAQSARIEKSYGDYSKCYDLMDEGYKLSKEYVDAYLEAEQND